MLQQLEKSLAVRRWLAVAVALLLGAGLWVVTTHTATAASVTVDAKDFAFTPADITVNVGDSVTWVNGDAESHAADGGSLSSPEIRAGESWSHTFTAPEELTYFCRFHTYMTGTIRVVEAGTTTTTAPATTAPPTTAPSTTTTADPGGGDTTTTTVDPGGGETTTTTTTDPGGGDTTTTTTTPPPTGGPGFQDVPDDPSARRPPGKEVTPPGDTTTTTTTAPGGSSTTTTAAGGTDGTTDGGTTDGGGTDGTTDGDTTDDGDTGGTTDGGTTSGGFQDVPDDPSDDDPPTGQPVVTDGGSDGGSDGASDGTSDGGTDGGTDGTDPPPGVDLGDGTQLAAYEEVDGAKEFHLTLTETTIEVSPGVTKQAYAFNGIVPGPVLRVNEGDRVRIVVDNQLPFPTSTHWHGMILPNEQDGVGGITQPHIEPGETYVYEWTAVATGTHWYHAHSSGRHIGKGLYGPLEVVPAENDIESDRDYRLMLGDTDLGFTLNGRSFPSTPTLEAEVGETVRLRLINTGDQVHAMHLHGVPFTVVAQDGITKVQPESMDTLTISPGQTFDLLFEQAYPGKWLVHCHMFVHSHMSADTHPPGESGMNGMVALLNVTGDPAPPSVGGDAGFLPDILPVSSLGDADLDVAALVGLGAFLALARRRRLRSLPTPPSSPTQQS